MNIEQIKNELPDYAKDIKLNLTSILTEEGAPDLNHKQIDMIALVSAYTTKNSVLIQSLISYFAGALTENEINAAKSAATIMAMNNIYYRFTHLVSDESYAAMPTKLRMNVIGNPGIDKIDFELMSLAASAINGCGKCMDAHAQTLMKHNVTQLAIQSTVRIAAVLNAAAMGIEIRN